MFRLYLLLALAQTVLAVIALISCVSAEEEEIRGLPRLIWALIIVFLPLAGSIAWFYARRGTRTRDAGHRRGPAPWNRNRQRPLGPDDDPEFLRSIGGTSNPGPVNQPQPRPDDERRRGDRS
ncbi:MAG TPA: PLD nuclease N-terminal domain-containing protein [Micromonosporaceae bacterium]